MKYIKILLRLKKLEYRIRTYPDKVSALHRLLNRTPPVYQEERRFLAIEVDTLKGQNIGDQEELEKMYKDLIP